MARFILGKISQIALIILVVLVLSETRSIQLNWQGPFSWTGLSTAERPDCTQVPDISNSSGIYLWTVEYNGGYLIYTAGLTRRSFRKRFREHHRAYYSGKYTVFDSGLMQEGKREVVWSGFWFTKNQDPQQILDYERRSKEIRQATDSLLSNYCIFFANVSSEPRLMERIEAAIMFSLYSQNAPVSTIPDRGMQLSPKWESEPEILVNSFSDQTLHGLASSFMA